MVTLVPQFVSQRVADWHAERDAVREAAPDAQEAETRVAAYDAARPRPAATVVDVADHFDHAREVAGIDHVGIGGDYDGCDPMPQGLEDVTAYPRVFEELARRGWSARDLAKASHENMLRVLGDNDADAEAGAEAEVPAS
jgi:membrane dipeptidase